MKFDFFTFGGRYFWNDVFSYQGWVIQRNVRSRRYRLLDTHNVRRSSGTFDECRDTLLKYIEACELDEPYPDSVILLHNFGRTKYSFATLQSSLQPLKANIIAVNYTSLCKGLNFQADILTQFLKNLDIKGKTYFITNGAGCLVLRKLIANCSNYRAYNIAGVIDINPINSGSDLADLLCRKDFFKNLLGPMLNEITPRKCISLEKLPKEIPHGIIFYPPAYQQLIKKMLSRFDSFPPLSPPSEQSYAGDILTLTKLTCFPLHNSKLGEYCRQYLETGSFTLPEEKESAN